MKALSLTRVSIIGVSFGGWLALHYATRRRDHIDRLVLINPSGIGAQRMSFLFKAIFLLMLGNWGRRQAMRMVIGETPKATRLRRFTL